VSQGSSTGLGLDIARRTVESAGGQLIVAASGLGGALVAMDFSGAENAVEQRS
jgi:signal transduction histidine kinase